MIIDVPKEIKNHEYQVGLIPAPVRELTRLGHKIFVETQAGAGIEFSNEQIYPMLVQKLCLMQLKYLNELKLSLKLKNLKLLNVKDLEKTKFFLPTFI